jgi:hypothetical protein
MIDHVCSQQNKQVNINNVQNKIRTQYWLGLLPNKNCQMWAINRDSWQTPLNVVLYRLRKATVLPASITLGDWKPKKILQVCVVAVVILFCLCKPTGKTMQHTCFTLQLIILCVCSLFLLALHYNENTNHQHQVDKDGKRIYRVWFRNLRRATTLLILSRMLRHTVSGTCIHHVSS